jgi:hypothetical protein
VLVRGSCKGDFLAVDSPSVFESMISLLFDRTDDDGKSCANAAAGFNRRRGNSGQCLSW